MHSSPSDEPSVFLPEFNRFFSLQALWSVVLPEGRGNNTCWIDLQPLNQHYANWLFALMENAPNLCELKIAVSHPDLSRRVTPKLFSAHNDPTFQCRIHFFLSRQEEKGPSPTQLFPGFSEQVIVELVNLSDDSLLCMLWSGLFGFATCVPNTD